MHNKYYKIGNLGYKIAVIGDIHYNIDYDLSIFNKIITNLKENKPDYICIVGDVIDTSTVVDKDPNDLKEFIKDLSLVSPTIITLGNHDQSYYKLKKEGNIERVDNWFKELNKIENVYYLNNKSLVRDNLCFTGLVNSMNYYFKKEDTDIFIKEMNEKIKLSKKYYNILLCHSPVNILNNKTLENSKDIDKVNLVLSGHMHNGLVFKIFDHKGNRGYVSPIFDRKKFFFPKYARNLIKKNNINLFVTGGVVKLSKAGEGFLYRLNKLYPISVDYIEI